MSIRDGMPSSFTVRIPRELREKMRRHREVNWSEVVRRAIEGYIKRLEEGERVVPSERLLEELMRLVSPQDLEPMSPEVEARMYESVREMEWRRLESTIRARS